MKNKKWLIPAGAAFVVLVAMVIVFLTLKQQYKPEKTVEAFKNAVQQKDTTQLKGLIVPDDKKAAVNKTSLTAFINYLKQNNNSYQVLKDSLNKQIENNDFTTQNQQLSLVKQGKKMGMFPMYKLQAKTVKLKVSGQNDDDKVDFTIKKLNLPPNKKKEQVYGPLLPGTYKVVATVHNQLGNFVKDEKKDVWGSAPVSVIIDDEKLVGNDKTVKQDILSAVSKLNSDLSVYETSGFNPDSFTNATESFKKSTGSDLKILVLKGYIDEIQSQYLGATANMDELNVNYFDNKWRADAEALVSYNSKVKLKGDKKYTNASYKSLRHYSLTYDKDKKKWLVDKVKEKQADGSEADDWEHKKEMKIQNPPLKKWSRKGQGI